MGILFLLFFVCFFFYYVWRSSALPYLPTYLSTYLLLLTVLEAKKRYFGFFLVFFGLESDQRRQLAGGFIIHRTDIS